MTHLRDFRICIVQILQYGNGAAEVPWTPRYAVGVYVGVTGGVYNDLYGYVGDYS